MFRHFLLFLFFLSTYSFLLGQKFTATLDKNQVAVNEPFVLTYQLEGMGGSQFRAPSINDEELEVVGGPNLTNKIAIVNGQMARATEISLVIVAKKNGKFTIPSATIVSGGKTIPSNPITVNVTGMARSTPPAVPSQPQVPTQTPQNTDNEVASKLKENIILRAELNKKSVYVGEPVLVNYKLYKRERMAPGTRMSMPSFEGFWMEEVNTRNQGVLANLNGKPYECFEMRKLMLFPQKSGQLTIPELDIQTEVYLKTNPFNFQMPSLDDVLSGRWQGGGVASIPYIAKSEPVILEVKPLPEAGKPANFSGLVGQFALATELSHKNTKTDEPIHLKVTITGNGNLKMVDAPKLDLPAGWEAYEPEKEEKIMINDEGQEGTITFDYTLVASQVGDFEVPPVKLAFFNLEKERYDELASPSFKVHVIQGEISQSDSTDKANAEQANASESTFNWKKYLLALLLFVGIVYFFQKKKQFIFNAFASKTEKSSTKNIPTSQDIAFNKEGEKLSVNPIESAPKLALPHIDSPDFYQNCIAFLKQEMNQKFAFPHTILLQDIVQFFSKESLPSQTLDTYKQLLQACETALYAPNVVPVEKQGLLQSILAWKKELSLLSYQAKENALTMEDEWYFSKE